MKLASLLALTVAHSILVNAAETLPPVPDKQPEPPFARTPADAGVVILVPGFTVQELPVRLTSLNNIEYAPDGRLFAGGYDGRFHLLRDTNADGLEDKVDTFSPEPGANYPLGMAVHEGAVYAVLTDEVVRWNDTDNDGIPDVRTTVIKGFDDPELIGAPYLNHRRVDSSMAIAFGTDGAMYLTMGNAGYDNPYWHDKQKAPHYSTARRRGCLLRVVDGKVEQLSSGLRYIMSLQFNQHGDLFGTDQEGATWVPNGNPFDEFLHLQAGRHYGFPPRHPRWLPDVVDEPSVFDYGPQHQSTCGFRFNGPAPGRGRFGPETWAHDALVTGFSRANLWRTKLAKTAAGYVAQNASIAKLGLMPADCAISPQGDLVVCCHSGKPDWGNGPKGEGRIFKIRFTNADAPQPVLTWAASESQTVVVFDRPLGNQAASKATFEGGHYVAAADQLETIRPDGYNVVKMQRRQPRTHFAIDRIRPGSDATSLVIQSTPRTTAWNYAISLGGKIELGLDLNGLESEWQGQDGARWTGWLPHPDFVAAREFTRGSATHNALWKAIATPGKLILRGQLDLNGMLIPATQPGSDLGYSPEPETVSITFKSDGALQVDAPGTQVESISQQEVRMKATVSADSAWQPITITVATPAKTLDVAFTTNRSSQPRALPVRRFLMPFAKPAPSLEWSRTIPEIAGGDWNAGRSLFNGKATCATCHQLRGEGFRVGPELGNLVHRDYASTLRDIAEPDAIINPDAIGYTVTLRDGLVVVGTRLAETAEEMQIAQPGGTVTRLKRTEIASATPMPTSLMPPGLEKMLTKEELRDLMTYLLMPGK